MKQFEIIVGSTLGASEYVAEALQQCLLSKEYQASLHLTPDIHKINPQATWLICCSTHGAGELPDNIQSFAQQLDGARLADTQYLMVGLGDSSYDTFCSAATQLNTLMQDAKAQLLTDVLKIDVLAHAVPEEPALAWLENWLKIQQL